MPALPYETAVILIDHGSRLPESNRMLEVVAEQYRDLSGTAIVEAAHMELAEPTLAQAIDRCVQRGAQTIVIALFFLSPGQHSTRDIPALVREALAGHPGVTCHITEPLGADRRLAGLLHQRVLETLD
ncbi:MAG: cobalamin biosynthesis protein CbiX [Candidatus Hydrogenedentes bacterium]|nr:cobalamin biosynthesis protein CbiX [Candidatus Hydrogenedentota bacterium]MBI3117308.1 cobalamin biosynthesis protein CbiX [Candidatus Hydrogenedentota bacterium]